MESSPSAHRVTPPAAAPAPDQPPRPQWQVWTERALRWAVAIFFIYEAAPKVWHPDWFAESVNNYRLLPMLAVNWTAIILPWLELVCGIALLLGIAVRGAVGWVILMLIVFIIAISSALYRHLDISCGCGWSGPEGKRIGYEELVRDALLLATSGEHTFEEIAQLLGVPTGTAKWRVVEAKRQLKQKLAGVGCVND